MTRRAWLLWALIPVGAAAAVYLPITGNYFWADDFYSLYRIQNTPLREFLFLPQGDHLLDSAYAVFYASYRAFGTDPQAPDFRPHNYPRNRVVYTGTHDNDTTVGWWSADVGHSTRSMEEIEQEHAYVRRYLGIDGREVHWDFIRAVLASVADTAIVPVQDLLGLGSEARMNRPGTSSGNWSWRLRPGQLTPAILRRLAEMSATYDRV